LHHERLHVLLHGLRRSRHGHRQLMLQLRVRVKHRHRVGGGAVIGRPRVVHRVHLLARRPRQHLRVALVRRHGVPLLRQVRRRHHQLLLLLAEHHCRQRRAPRIVLPGAVPVALGALRRREVGRRGRQCRLLLVSLCDGARGSQG
jgi:hypothetical protein